MGLFSFIKEAGAKIFGGSAKAATADELQKELAGHGLPSDVTINVNGDKVTIAGKAVSTEEAEKIILALGNTVGVSQVESELIVTKDFGVVGMEFMPPPEMRRMEDARGTLLGYVQQSTENGLSPEQFASLLDTQGRLTPEAIAMRDQIAKGETSGATAICCSAIRRLIDWPRLRCA